MDVVTKRVISALVAIAVGAPILVFLGSTAIHVFTMLITIVCLYEYFSMVIPEPEFKEMRIFGISLGAFIMFLTIFFPKSFLGISAMSMSIFCVYYLIRVYAYPQFVSPDTQSRATGKYIYNLMSTFFGVQFFTVFIGYLPRLRTSNLGLEWIILLMAIIWIGDTGAFFGGRKFGKHKLYPSVSPGKTVEGAFSGLLSSVIAAVICKLTFFPELEFLDCFVLGVIGGSIGQAGDLVESFIKRSASVKDSGILMPGHGGLFDRFDGLIFAAPFFFYYAEWFF